MDFRTEMHYRAKAIATGIGVLATAAATWLVTDDSASASLQQLLPHSLQPAVPAVVGILGVVLVHTVGTAATPASVGDWEAALQRAVDTAMADVTATLQRAIDTRLQSAPAAAQRVVSQPLPAPASPPPAVQSAAASVAKLLGKAPAPDRTSAHTAEPAQVSTQTSVVRLDPPPGL